MAPSTYVSVLVRAHLRSVTPLPREELLALKRAIAELGAFGRFLSKIMPADAAARHIAYIGRWGDLDLETDEGARGPLRPRIPAISVCADGTNGSRRRSKTFEKMPGAGIEPARGFPQGIFLPTTAFAAARRVRSSPWARALRRAFGVWTLSLPCRGHTPRGLGRGRQVSTLSPHAVHL